MNDIERAELWKKLRTQEADLLESVAASDPSDKQRDYKLHVQLFEVRERMWKLREAEAIREQLAACEDVFDVATRKP